MKLFDVSGMSCASCVSHVENAVRKVKGVKSVEVNLLTSSMNVEFENEISVSEIIDAVSKAGYEAKVKESDINSEKNKNQKKFFLFNFFDSETKKLLLRFCVSLILLFPLMYFAMAAEKSFISGIVQAVISFLILVINKKFFVSGIKSAFHLACNMDTLVAMGSGVSFLFSIYNLLKQNYFNLYFDSAAMIVTLITIGKTLESYSKGKTTDALNSLVKLAPKKAVVIKDEKEITVLISEIKPGDVVVVKSGESVPVDGIIINGSASFNESTLTGESVPKDKGKDEKVFAATLCVSGNVFVRVEKTDDETAFSKIVQLVTSASASKAPVAKIADKVSAVFVPVVILISIITFLCHFISDYIFYGGFSIPIFAEALSFAVCVLVISCPCSLGLATPVSIMVANGIAAKRKILFKTAEALENVSKIEICVFDKTGTVTNGVPVVKNIYFTEQNKENEKEILSLIYSLEKKSSHPLAEAICTYFEKQNIPLLQTEEFTEKISFGISAVINGRSVKGGNEKFVFPEKNLSVKIEDGETPLYFSVDDKTVLVITLLDVAKTTSLNAVLELKKMDIESVLLTGDNEKTAEVVASSVGIEKVFASATPEQKAGIIKKLSEVNEENNFTNSRKIRRVAMIGDGVNDAPALKSAFAGFAIGSGTDVAVDSADVVLVKNDLRDVVKAIKISRRTMTNIRQNLFWAFFYNAVCIPVAAGVFASGGIILKPVFGALAMSFSSIFVVMNALRLNFMKLENKMKKTIRINGMMCEHCEAHVKKALEALGSSAVVSHKSGTAIVEAPDEIPHEVLAKAVTDAGYEVVEIS